MHVKQPATVTPRLLNALQKLLLNVSTMHAMDVHQLFIEE